MSRHPAGQFQVAALKRAVLHLAGLGFTRAKDGDEVSLDAVITLPAGALRGTYAGPDKTSLMLDVTSTVRQVHETGLPITVTLTAPEGMAFWVGAATLLLFTE